MELATASKSRLRHYSQISIGAQNIEDSKTPTEGQTSNTNIKYRQVLEAARGRSQTDLNADLVTDSPSVRVLMHHQPEPLDSTMMNKMSQKGKAPQAQLPKKLDVSKNRSTSINKDIEAFISTPKKTPKNKSGKISKKPGSIKVSDGRKNDAYQTMGTFQKTNADSFLASPTLGGRPTQMTNVKDDTYYQQTMHKTMTELDGAKYNSAEGGSTT